MRFHRFSCGGLAALLVLFCGCSSVPPDRLKSKDIPAHVQVWVSSADGRQLLWRAPDLTLGAETTDSPTIDIDLNQRFQTMVGFGAAITDASAFLIEQRMSDQQREPLMRELFGPDPGLGIGFVRLTIGASDFSMTHYSLDDVPAGETDSPLAHFSLAPIKKTVIPVAKQALKLNPSLRVMASPWSAPGWMKSGGSLVHGTLLPEFYSEFAQYLTRYIEAMRAEGIPIHAITLQNEPHFEPKNYPGMRLDAPMRAQLIGKYVGPALARLAPSTEIFEWDHNWDRPQEPLQVLNDALAAQYVSAVAWHCYAGHVPAQSEVHAAHPDKDAYLTECSGGEWGSESPLLHMTRQLIVASVRNWARGVLLWNLALDESAGPHLGGCGNCRGLITINSHTGEVKRNEEYYVIAHASRFVRAGATRVASTESGAELANVAFQNPDGSIALILVNSVETPQTLTVRCRGLGFTYTLRGRSVATLTWAYN